MDNSDKKNPVEVNCVRDEYIYISQQPCENCRRKNAYRLRTQTLVGRGDRNYDVLDTECQFCGYKKCFTFDVTECFGDLEKQFTATFKDRDKHEDLDWDKET